MHDIAIIAAIFSACILIIAIALAFNARRRDREFAHKMRETYAASYVRHSAKSMIDASRKVP